MENKLLFELVNEKKLLTHILLNENVKEYESVIFKIIPELNDEFGCTQDYERTEYDVWEHTIVGLENITERDINIKIAYLLHDIGKPSTKSLDENGKIYFPGHPLKSEEISKDILNRLKFSKKDQKEILFLIRYHDTKRFEKGNVRVCRKWLKKLFVIKRADAVSRKTSFRIKRNEELIRELLEYVNNNGNVKINLDPNFV